MASEMKPIAVRQKPPMSTWTRYARLSLLLALFLAVVMLVMFRITRPTHVSKGLKLSMSGSSLMADPIIVRVKRQPAHAPGLEFRGRTINKEELRTALRQEFARRANWTVFVDGDENCSANDVIQVVDLVAGLHGRAALVSRKESSTSGALGGTGMPPERKR